MPYPSPLPRDVPLWFLGRVGIEVDRLARNSKRKREIEVRGRRRQSTGAGLVNRDNTRFLYYWIIGEMIIS
ncbi:MAG: hypothetical protein ACOX86_01730 [Pelotomaculaceae bacterium]|nr:hypothetical protein [Bacillota bacterium]HHU85375.1 hypothetical protein [Peptococcaceae bacterium]